MDDVAQLGEGNPTVLDAEVVRQLSDLFLGQTDKPAQLLPKNIDELRFCSRTHID